VVITKDRVVTFFFTLKDEIGNIIDKREQPSVYLHGYRHIMPLIEQALEGKALGDNINILIPPEKAFGKRDGHLIRTFPASQFPEVKHLTVGMNVYSPSNRELVMKIIKIENNEITVDANHPLAGQTLIFEAEILGVREATQEEILSQKIEDKKDEP